MTGYQFSGKGDMGDVFFGKRGHYGDEDGHPWLSTNRERRSYRRTISRGTTVHRIGSVD